MWVDFEKDAVRGAILGISTTEKFREKNQFSIFETSFSWKLRDKRKPPKRGRSSLRKEKEKTDSSDSFLFLSHSHFVECNMPPVR